MYLETISDGNNHFYFPHFTAIIMILSKNWPTNKRKGEREKKKKGGGGKGLCLDLNKS